MSFIPADSWRALVLAKRDRHLSNKNRIAIFVFGITAKDFPHGALTHEKRASLFAKDDTGIGFGNGVLAGLTRTQGVRVMKRKIVLTAVAIVLCLGTSMASSQTSVPAKESDTSKGKTLVDADGMTLYTFDRDNAPGKSACNGKCAGNWPPFTATSDAQNMGNWTVIVRDDGSKQWAYKGKPLYRWIDDKKPGDVDGDGRNNVWHVAVP